MNERFNSTLGQKGEDSNQVYVLDVDKSLYDISHPDYLQTHCLRFEIDRSKGNKKVMGIKITDIDYHLEGNRHARAIS